MKEGTNTFKLTCRAGRVVSERASAQYFLCGMPCCHLGSREADCGEQKMCPIGWGSGPYVCKSKRVAQCTKDCLMAHSAIKTEKKKTQLIYFCKRESLNVFSAQTCNYFGNQN